MIGLSAAAPIANVVAGTGGMGRGPASTAAIAAAMIASTDKTGPRSAQLLAKRVAATRMYGVRARCPECGVSLALVAQKTTASPAVGASAGVPHDGRGS